VIRTELI